MIGNEKIFDLVLNFFTLLIGSFAIVWVVASLWSYDGEIGFVLFTLYAGILYLFSLMIYYSVKVVVNYLC